MKKTSLLLVLILLTFATYAQFEKSENRSNEIGIKLGILYPLDDQVNGSYIVRYNATGSQEGTTVSGFGSGINMFIEDTYYYSNFGVWMNVGIRTHSSHNINLNHVWGNDTYENSLLLIPVQLGPCVKFDVNDHLMLYINAGLGYYYGDMKMRHESTTLMGVVTVDSHESVTHSLGLTTSSGAQFKIYHDIWASFELNYSHVESKWEINNTENDSFYEISLNTGGMAINLGLKYIF